MTMMWRMTPIATCVAVTLALVAPVEANGPIPNVRLLALEPSSGGVPGPIKIFLYRDGIEEVDVQSRIVTEAGFSAVQTVGLTVLDPAATTESMRANPPEGYAVAGGGDTITFPSPYTASLAAGTYVEKLLITIILRGAPIDISDARFFEVTTSGVVVPLSRDEYSERVDRFMTLATGRRVRVGQGVPGQPAHAFPIQYAVPVVSR